MSRVYVRASAQLDDTMSDWRDLMRRREQLRALEESYADEFGMLNMITDTLPELGSPTAARKEIA